MNKKHEKMCRFYDTLEKRNQYVAESARKLKYNLGKFKRALHDEYGEYVFIDTSSVIYKPNDDRFYELDINIDVNIHTENSMYTLVLHRYASGVLLALDRDYQLVAMHKDGTLGDNFKHSIRELMRG